MKQLATLSLAAILSFALASDGYARGGFSSGGSRGGFSSSRSFSSGRSFSSPSRSYSSPSRSFSTTRSAPARSVTTTTTTRRSGGYGGGYGGGMMYPGFGMGYGYSNGMLTGLILGNMMHPHGTTVYTGGGYSGQALLYPDGRVVNQQGYQVGNYANGQFTAQEGGMVAQPAPTDAAPAQPVPVVVEKPGPSGADIVCGLVIFVLLVLILFVAFI